MKNTYLYVSIQFEGLLSKPIFQATLHLIKNKIEEKISFLILGIHSNFSKFYQGFCYFIRIPILFYPNQHNPINKFHDEIPLPIKYN